MLEIIALTDLVDKLEVIGISSYQLRVLMKLERLQDEQIHQELSAAKPEIEMLTL